MTGRAHIGHEAPSPATRRARGSAGWIGAEAAAIDRTAPVQRLAAAARLADGAAAATLQRAAALGIGPNRTGLPDALKSGIEALSGLSMDAVRVYRDSPRPAGMGALAYAQGSDIHLAPGQERHLAHEAWHVVQQMQGRVRSTEVVAGIPVNSDPTLEREADMVSSRLSGSHEPATAASRYAPPPTGGMTSAMPAQRKLHVFWPKKDRRSGEPFTTLDKMAKVLDEATEQGHAHVQKQVTLLRNGAKFDYGMFPASTGQRALHFVNVLGKGSSSLKLAAAGYMIEDHVSAAVGDRQGFESQYVMSAARPDFRIEAEVDDEPAAGVVDITSTKQKGHIARKNFSMTSFSYAAECLYGALDLGDGVVDVADDVMADVEKLIEQSASKRLSDQISDVMTNIDTIKRNLPPQSSTAVLAGAILNKATAKDFKKKQRFEPSSAEQVKAIDDMMLELRQRDDFKKYWNDTKFDLPTVGQMLEGMRSYFGLEGFPPHWQAEQVSNGEEEAEQDDQMQE